MVRSHKTCMWAKSSTVLCYSQVSLSLWTCNAMDSECNLCICDHGLQRRYLIVSPGVVIIILLIWAP